jgi:4a-hydroxytetrahydrobiopterin dehydratase
MDALALAGRHCRPLSGSASRLPADQVSAALPQLPGWQLVEDGCALAKTFDFADYYRTLAFVNALAHVAHREDHHPDLGVHYNRCVVRYSTHDAGGLTENDLICAAKAEQLYAG